MSDDAEVIRIKSEYTGAELAAVAASFVQCEPDQVCAVVMVVTLHGTRGTHEVRMATTIDDNPRAVATVLRHAADHAHGGCESCRTKRERRNRRGH